LRSSGFLHAPVTAISIFMSNKVIFQWFCSTQNEIAVFVVCTHHREASQICADASFHVMILSYVLALYFVACDC